MLLIKSCFLWWSGGGAIDGPTADDIAFQEVSFCVAYGLDSCNAVNRLSAGDVGGNGAAKSIWIDSSINLSKKLLCIWINSPINLKKNFYVFEQRVPLTWAKSFYVFE